MKVYRNTLLPVCLLGFLPAAAWATVSITGLGASPASPQLLGTPITWTVTATDTGAGPLTFQFSVKAPGSTAFTLFKDFNAGTKQSNGTWTAQPFVWAPTGIEGSFTVQVIAQDFGTNESATQTAAFTVKPLVAGNSPAVAATSNPLVALFGAPSCAAGSSMRVHFQDSAKRHPSVNTNYLACHPPLTMNFEIAGMYPSTAYTMFSQTQTGTTVINGPPVNFTTGALPSRISFPTFTVLTKAGAHSDNGDRVIVTNPIQDAIPYLAVATDLSGKINWYYYPGGTTPQYVLVTRPLANGGLLTIQNGQGWNAATQWQQLVRQVDLAGNVVRETNTGVMQQLLLQLGAADAAPCNSIALPAAIGAACMGAFHHEAIQFANGDIGLIADIEKIFPPGTQGDTSGLNVDVVGDMVIILNSNWQPVYYWDSFLHDGGGTQLDINRAAVLGETCTVNQNGCPPMLLAGTPGVSGSAHDWLHANSLYLWATDSYGGAGNDLVLSLRHQDWVLKIDYNNGAGTGNIIWRLGPCGDFTFNNVNSDPWPWFSHQHEVALENNGAGPMTIMDNGNTRISPPSGPGSSSGCLPGSGSGHSRGMALTLNEPALQATPVLSQDLGYYSTAMGSAQLLSNNDYYFLVAIVLENLTTFDSYSEEIYPTAGTVNGTTVLNIRGLEAYRGWQMQSLYNPPTT